MKIILFILLFSTSAAAKTDQKSLTNKEKRKVTCLLELVERSHGIFIRNGSQHTSQDARQHLENKYKRATKSSWPYHKTKKVTAMDFINKLASRSSFSGKDYKISINHKTFTTREWLIKQLNEHCQNP